MSERNKGMVKGQTRFVTEHGVDVPAVDSDQMREVDRIAVEETGPNLYQMMENAGRNLASLAIEVLGKAWSEARILVLAGSGGNGGGGICAARHSQTASRAWRCVWPGILHCKVFLLSSSRSCSQRLPKKFRLIT